MRKGGWGKRDRRKRRREECNEFGEDRIKREKLLGVKRNRGGDMEKTDRVGGGGGGGKVCDCVGGIEEVLDSVGFRR